MKKRFETITLKYLLDEFNPLLMANRQEIQKIQTMMKRTHYAGIFFGFAIACVGFAAALHSIADPNIANSVFEYSVERQALHSTILTFRNISVGAAIVTFIIGFFLDNSVSDLAK